MKFLFTTCPAQGHLFLLVPLAWTLRSAGHDVLIPASPSLEPAASATGLPTTAVSDVDMMQVMRRTFAPLLAGGVANASPADRGRYAVQAFTELAATVADDVVGIARDWQPDVVVHDSIEFAGPLAAHLAGVPAVALGWGTWLGGPILDAVHQALRPLYGAHGVDPAEVGTAQRLDVCPPELREPNTPPLTGIRFEPYNGSRPVPRHLLGRTGRRRICVTVGGSVGSHADMSVPLLRPILDALSEVDAEVVVALGGVAESELGALPANVSVQHWIPLNQLLPTCDLVVHHGGSGTTMTAARHGVPQLAFPQLADQFRFAERVHACGAGRRLGDADVTVPAIRAAALELLADPAVHNAAGELARQMAEQTPLPEVVPLLENAGALATANRPG